MKNLFAGELLTVPAGHAISRVTQIDGEIHVVAGRLWITVEGEQDDYWLAAGESMAVEAGRLVVAEADRVPGRLVFPRAPVSGRGARPRPIHLYNA